MIFLLFAMKTQRKISAAQMSSAENFFAWAIISSVLIFSKQDSFCLHFCLPCREQGRQGISFCRICAFSPTGKNPHSFVVGPKRASRGVSTASARCIGPESPVMSREHRLRTAQSSRKFVLLIRFFPYMFSGKSPLPTKRI